MPLAWTISDNDRSVGVFLYFDPFSNSVLSSLCTHSTVAEIPDRNVIYVIYWKLFVSIEIDLPDHGHVRLALADR